MHAFFRGILFLVIALLFTGVACRAQLILKPAQTARTSIDLGVTFAGERSKPDATLCCFWFKGGGVDASMTLWKGFGVAAAINGDHAGNYIPRYDENKVSFLVGPRYTIRVGKSYVGGENGRRFQFFGQGLLGVAHGFDTLYTNGETSANEFAFQAGGGMNLYFTRKFGIRPIDLEFVHSQIGATGFSNQNDFRLATGLIFQF